MGATDTFAAHYLPTLLVDIETHYPLAQVELVVEFSVNLYAKLLRGELDVGRPVRPHALAAAGLRARARRCPTTGWARRSACGGMKVATPQALASMPIVTHPAPSLLYETIQAWFAAAA